MNRRDFLKRMAAMGLVVAAPKLIFDLGHRAYLKEQKVGALAREIHKRLMLHLIDEMDHTFDASRYYQLPIDFLPPAKIVTYWPDLASHPTA